MERRDPLAVESLQILDDLTIAGIIIIHVGNKDHPGKIVFFAVFPCLLGSNLHTGLSIYYDDRRICDA